MSRRGENIWKRKDGRREARYIKGRDPKGKALYASVYAKTYAEVKKKREAVLRELKAHTFCMVFLRHTAHHTPSQ